MALKIFEKFSPRANPADTNYPYGSIKNESVPGAKDGTPLDASWGNDMLGFTDALLDEAGITPNGLPDTVQSSQRLEAVKTVARKPLELKIFQSPTDNLTKVSTFTDGVDVVYEVRKTSDSSLATIYSDAAGTTEIVQNGTDNKSGSDGVVEFHIGCGEFYITSSGSSSTFNVVGGTRFDFPSVNDSNTYIGKTITLIDYDEAIYEVVSSSDSGGFYLDGFSSNKKLKLIHGADSVSLSKLVSGTATDAKSAIEYLAGKRLTINVSGDFVSSTIDGVETVKLAMNGGDISSVNSSLDRPLFENVKTLRIDVTGKSTIGRDSIYPRGVHYVFTGNTITSVIVNGELYCNGNSLVRSHFGCDSQITPDSPVTGVRIDITNGAELTGFARAGIDYPCNSGGNASALVSNIKSYGGAGRCIQFGDNASGFNNVSVIGCPRLGEVFSSGSSETKGVLIYGDNYHVERNTITDVLNAGVSGAEGIYVKGSYGTVTRNSLLNAGSSSDGCITVKGSAWFDSDVGNEGEWSNVALNTIRMTDINYDSKGIGIFDSRVNVVNNNLIDLREGRNTLNYSMSISVGGSNTVSNVLVQGNKSVGWVHFIGDWNDQFKGRCSFADNIKIKDNTAVQLAGGYGFCFGNAVETLPRLMVASSSGGYLEIEGAENQNAQFEPSIYPVGSEIEVFSTSNSGIYTITAVERYRLYLTGALVDATESTGIVRTSTNLVEITGNTISGALFGIRTYNGKCRNLKIDGNNWQDCSYVYRIQNLGGVGKLTIGSNETFDNITNTPIFQTLIADEFAFGLNFSSENEVDGTITIEDIKNTFVIEKYVAP